MHEGGISTPLIVRWPGVVKPSALTGQVGHIIDIMLSDDYSAWAQANGRKLPETGESARKKKRKA